MKRRRFLSVMSAVPAALVLPPWPGESDPGQPAVDDVVTQINIDRQAIDLLGTPQRTDIFERFQDTKARLAEAQLDHSLATINLLEFFEAHPELWELFE